MILRLGEVVLIQMQFHQATGAKVRPALVFLDTGDDDFCCGAHHDVASPIRVHKPTVLAKTDIVRSLGLLSEPDRESLVALLCRAFCPKTGGM